MNRCSIARVCPACGKVHNYPNKQGYCEKHAMQLKRFGKLLDSNSRSIYDPNEYRVEGNTTYIYVYDKRGNKLPQEIIIDTEDLSKLIQYKIFLQHKSKGNLYYGMCNIERNKKIAIHKMLCESSTTVDHINGNTLDNRKCNLRAANMSMQNLNKVNSKGIQKGVNKDKNGNFKIHGYAATLGYNNRRYISKYYATEEEAMYYRYLLLQLLPFKTNYDLSFMSKLSQEQKDIINRDFENRFKNRVL